MGPESFFTRWWNAVRPLPAAQALDAAALKKKRRQSRLIGYTGVVLGLAAGSWYAYSYATSAPQRAAAEFEKGLAQMRPGSYENAIRFFDESIGIWPNLPEAYMSRGIALHAAGRRDAALEDLDRALDLNPSLTRAINEEGKIYAEAHDPDKAVKAFTRSISIQPSNEAYYQRANLYESRGEHQKALEDYDRAITELVDAPYAYRARAVAKEKLGDGEGAREDRAKALRLEDYR